MEARLRVPYRDTAADDLGWRLGEARRPALAVLELDLTGLGRLELRLLGSSHQVLFTTPAAPGRPGHHTPQIVVSEVVACDAGAPGLPATAHRHLGAWSYRFRAATYRLAPPRFAYRVDRLTARLAGHPAAIVGRFPGSPHAVTALVAGGSGSPTGGIRWRTCHAYPQDGRLVVTDTSVRPR